MLKYHTSPLRLVNPCRINPQAAAKKRFLHKFAPYSSMAATTNGNHQPAIKFYTNHGCPWAHRAHIVLKELGLPYEEVIIDLGTPREPWYLELNPVCMTSSTTSFPYLLTFIDLIIKESVVTWTD